MTRFLRSESEDNEDNQEEEEEEEEGLYCGNSFKSTPLSSPGSCGGGGSPEEAEGNQQHYPILAILVAALRKSLVTCSVEKGDDDDDSMDIGRPTHVRHLSHVTFDRFSGFLGLPTEFQPQLPPRVPSASASVFGVSAESMQCSYDQRGNSVPTILLMMQKQLYSAGGLQAEGIFRITGENSQEEYVRSQLNRGIMPCGIDVHCLAGLVKAWLRELPTGVLDSLTAEQVMHCNTENDCVQLAKLLPPTEAALLDWAINLMADVVQHEHHNKMNARNIAMVFAPNMTQMADPLTALIHAVQVMNFLKTLILKTLREREELATEARLISSCVDSHTYSSDCHPPDRKETSLCNLNTSAASDRLQFDCEEETYVSPKKSDLEEGFKSHTKDSTTPVVCKRESLESDCREGYDEGGEVEGTFYWPSLRKGVRKLCRNAVPQTTKPEKKSTRGLENVNTRGGDGEAWV